MYVKIIAVAFSLVCVACGGGTPEAEAPEPATMEAPPAETPGTPETPEASEPAPEEAPADAPAETP